MTENNTTISSNDPINENNLNKTEKEEDSKDLEIVQNLQNINVDSEDLTSLIKDLQTFESLLSNVCYIFKNEVFQILKKLIEKDNIKIHLILSRIYINIISHDSLYNNYLMFDKEDKNKIEKVDRLIQLI